MITNKHGLPQSIVDFLTRDYYVPGASDFSVTSLLSPPQQLQLKIRHADDITEDAMDKVWSVFGSAVHELLDKHENSGAITEERLYIDTVDGVKIGGQVDHYQDGVITDYKVTSVWSVIYDSKIPEWEKQQNMYAYIFRKNGYPVDAIQICAILRDWSETKAQQDSEYPQTPIVIIPLTLWDDAFTAEFINGLVTKHVDAFDMPSQLLPECTPDEMWEKPTTYAMYAKESNKRATKIFDNPDEAEAACPKGGKVEVRHGERTRCERYCPVKDFCWQYKRMNDGT